MGEWISVKDRLTKVGVEVLISSPLTNGICMAYLAETKNGQWWVVSLGGGIAHYYLYDVAYWLELPAPPHFPFVDMNGKEICDGDIVTINGGKTPLAVTFDGSVWRAENRSAFPLYSHELSEDEDYLVIGNVRDNPELLDRAFEPSDF